MRRAVMRPDRTSPVDSSTVLDGAPRVLVVESDATFRRQLGRALRRDGYQVVEAADGHSALQCLGTDVLRRELPELVIVDARRPGCGGLDVFEAVREMDWTLPVILITTQENATAGIEPMRRGATTMFPGDDPIDDVDQLCALARGLARRD